jgi:hypothetical protein
MSSSSEENKNRFQVDKNLYVLDSSGAARDGEAITRQVDAIFKRVEETFKPDKVRVLSPPQADEWHGFKCADSNDKGQQGEFVDE